MTRAFSLNERIVLINQFQILKAVDPHNASDYDEKIEILENGYSLFYDQINHMDDDELSPDECMFVLNILDCYRFVDDFISSNPTSKSAQHYFSYFHGFDGNNETHLMVFARFLIKVQKKFQEQVKWLTKNDNLNAHAGHRDKYEMMIAKWKEVRAQKATDEIVLSILDA